jgi:hypothetical protein
MYKYLTVEQKLCEIVKSTLEQKGLTFATCIRLSSGETMCLLVSGLTSFTIL